MIRSLIVIALAIVCGIAAAVGANQFLDRNRKVQAQTTVETQQVVVAATKLYRGNLITKDSVKLIDWPKGYGPTTLMTNLDEAVGRMAVTAIMPEEPIQPDKLTEKGGGGVNFVSSILDEGKRAYTIHTRGPSASVAGFVRPGDHVDVLLNLRGGANDETGGGSATMLLQNVEVLAIDQMLDSNADTMQMLERWAKGDNFTSVTLIVDTREATKLFLGQSTGELSLALRNGNDKDPVHTEPETIKNIRFQQMAGGTETPDENTSHAVPPAPFPDVPAAAAIPSQKSGPDSEIFTIRGNSVGRVSVAVKR